MPEICLMTKAWRSGAAWVAQMIAQAIAEQGATIAFVAPRADPASRDPAHPNLLRIETPRELIDDHPKHRRVTASLKRIASSLWSVCRLRPTTRTFIFSIPEPLVFTLPLFLFLRVTGAQVVFIAHDSQPHAWSFPRSLRWIERAAHAWSYSLASRVVALTPTVRSALVHDFHVQKDKIVVIPHGPFSLGEVEPLPGNGNLLIFGSLRRNKSVLEVIQGIVLARQRGLQVRLVLAGEPLKQEPGYWNECLSAIDQDPAGFDVRAGFFPDEKLPELLAGIDAFVLAYQHFESQSGVAILASLAGRPILGTRAGGLGELYDLGMVGQQMGDVVSPETIATAIEAFFAIDSDQWRARSAEGSAAMAKRLRWDKIADQYVALARPA